MDTHALGMLQVGQLVPFGGDRCAVVSAELAARFVAGDHLVVVQESGALLHVPAAQHALVDRAIGGAIAAFEALVDIDDDRITAFYDHFAALLEDDETFASIAAANNADVASAASRGRSTTRLVLSASMRRSMIDGLRAWRDTPGDRFAVVDVVEHDGWSVRSSHAPLGVVGFVFEGRPNVFADATGVLRTGNTAVLRIGSDALGTATAIVEHALRPALSSAGLPPTAVTLLDTAERSAGWALFGDRRLGLAVARGSGEAVGQLGAVARQAGVPVSLHGTGGAWMIAAATADATRFERAVLHSLDRKVCNTLNVCCIVADRAAELVPAFVASLLAAGRARNSSARLHMTGGALPHPPEWASADALSVTGLDDDALGTEWEWEDSPEVTLVVVSSVDEAVELFNRYSPRLVASLISEDPTERQRFERRCDAPFVGDGFTRWVDGQFALDRPELGLSNWEGGRLLARSGVLSGDSVYTVRLSATVRDIELHR